MYAFHAKTRWTSSECLVLQMEATKTCTYLFLSLCTNYWFIQLLDIVIFNHSYTSEELFDGIHKVMLYVISSHVCYIVTHGGFGDMNTDDNKEDFKVYFRSL